jgi:hypothetical protein
MWDNIMNNTSEIFHILMCIIYIVSNSDKKVRLSKSPGLAPWTPRSGMPSPGGL